MKIQIVMVIGVNTRVNTKSKVLSYITFHFPFTNCNYNLWTKSEKCRRQRTDIQRKVREKIIETFCERKENKYPKKNDIQRKVREKIIKLFVKEKRTDIQRKMRKNHWNFQVGTMGFSNASLEYLNYPTQVIFGITLLFQLSYMIFEEWKI